MNEISWASAILAQPSCAVKDNKLVYARHVKCQKSIDPSVDRVFSCGATWLLILMGAKIALALLLRVIFSKITRAGFIYSLM